MKRLKMFEEYSEETETGGFITVPKDFEQRLKMAHDDAKAKQEVYRVPKNQLRIDLYYALYNGIKEFLMDVKDLFYERTQQEYERKLNQEIDGLMYKFTGGGGPNLNNIKDKGLVKKLLWDYINERLPYDEVDYYHTYNLRDKVLKLSEDFVNDIVEKNLFNTAVSENLSQRRKERENRFKAPTLDEIRKWSDEELEDLRWAYDRVRQASGERAMVTQNWFNTLMKRVKIVREERGLN